MFRKFIAFFTIIVMVLSLMSVAYAESGFRSFTDEISVFQLLEDKDGSKTFDSQLILSGRSKEGVVITISHYWYEVGHSESILKKNTNKDANEEGKWVLASDPEELTIGASGIIAKTIELEKGQNKIVLTGKDRAGNKKTDTIMVELVNENELKEYINNLILKDINIKQK